MKNNYTGKNLKQLTQAVAKCEAELSCLKIEVRLHTFLNAKKFVFKEARQEYVLNGVLIVAFRHTKVIIYNRTGELQETYDFEKHSKSNNKIHFAKVKEIIQNFLTQY
jgi:hypothetical protein